MSELVKVTKAKKEKKALETAATFVPSSINEISIDFIMNYVQAKGASDVKWLKDVASTPVAPDKNGKPRKISFIEIRKEFVKKYFPDLAPKAGSNRVSMYDKIMGM